MKRKGFTLIELLAVILIIGIVLLIAIPSVSKIIDISKKKSIKASANGILDAVNFYYAENVRNIEDELVFECSNSSCVNGETKIDYNGKVSNGILVVNNDGDKAICINIGKYYASKSIDSNNIETGKGYCDGYENGTFILSNDPNAKYRDIIETLLLSEAISWDYGHTGDEKTLVIPFTGTYKLEVWGAQSGSYAGFGGYSVGTISLNKNQEIFINVGGKGDVKDGNGSYCTTSATVINGGYNGGGTGYAGKDQAVSGGGATHIALESGLLSTFSSKIDKILIVAGGGGYAAGGGYKGNDGTILGFGTQMYYGLGGTQTSGGANYNCDDPNDCSETTTGGYAGSFGQGGNGNNTSGCSGSGGGGGFYGGGGSSSGTGSSGGGSGYIGNPLLTNKLMYCYNCGNLNDENVHTVDTIGFDALADRVGCPNGHHQSALPKCAKAGNGAAKITLVGLPENFNNYKELYDYIINEKTLSWDFYYTGEPQNFVTPLNGKYKIQLWGAQGGSFTGYGAYTTGNIQLTKSDELYVYVGGKGKNATMGTDLNLGGYNGGGNGGPGTNTGGAGGSGGGGGGATDVRLKLDNLNSRIMVAAGGAGTRGMSTTFEGSSCGGTLSSQSWGLTTLNTYVATGALGASQISGGTGGKGNTQIGKQETYAGGSGTFGIGGSGVATTFSGGGGAGGGGYYGGGAGGSSSNGDGGAGSGGSSYISGYNGAIAVKSETDTSPRSDNNGNECQLGTTNINCSEHYSGFVFESPQMIDGCSQMPVYNSLDSTVGNKEHGHARITFISID